MVDSRKVVSLNVLSRSLFTQILDDHCSDLFVCELVWERLGYELSEDDVPVWFAGPSVSFEWRIAFPDPPQIIAERPASVRLTRSIAKQHKQLLKEQLGFAGYRIGELYPRRTRRATAVSWLLAWLAERSEPLAEQGPLAPELPAPRDPVHGHPGDLPLR